MPFTRFFEDNYASETQSRITTYTHSLLQTVIGSSVSIALRNALMFLGGSGAARANESSPVPCLWYASPGRGADHLPGRRVRRLSRDAQDSIAHVGSYLSEALGKENGEEAYTHEAIDQARFKDHVEAAFGVFESGPAPRHPHHPGHGAGAWGHRRHAMGGGTRCAGGADHPGELAAFIFYALLVAGSVGAISEVLADLQRAAGATERLLELLEAKSALPVPEAPTPSTADSGALVIEGLTFAYPTPGSACPEGPVPAVAPGEVVAPSGAGKSTLFLTSFCASMTPMRAALRSMGRPSRP